MPMGGRLGAWSARLFGDGRLDCRVALTFDAEHPSRPSSPHNLQSLLDSLEAARSRATFFVQGRWASAYPELTRRIVEKGHLIGNHSHWHAPLTALTNEGIRESVTSAEAAIIRTAGVDPRPWFRCPYGSGMDDSRVLTVLDELGYHNVPWDVAAGDWLPDKRAGELVRDVLHGCRSHGDGARVLLHTWPDVTSAALPSLLAQLRSAGAQFVRMDETSTQ